MPILMTIKYTEILRAKVMIYINASSRYTQSDTTALMKY